MKKETTKSILGLLLIPLCGIGLIFHIIEVLTRKPRDWHDWTLMGITLYGLINGVNLVFKKKR